jgi:dihydroorotate dehydrogenase
MKLITKEIQKKLDKAGYHGDVPICKFFNPCGAGTWIIFGQDKEDKDTLSCVADLGIGFVEAGSVSLSELEGARLPYGLKIE